MTLAKGPGKPPAEDGNGAYESVPKPMRPKINKKAVGGLTAAIGSLATALIMSVTARIDADTAEKRADSARKEAASTSQGARSQSALTSIELSASYSVITERLVEMEDAIQRLAIHSEYLERRSERIESLLFQIAGNRRAVREYAPPEPPEHLEAPTSKARLPDSPKKALQQQLAKDPTSVFK